MKSNNNNLYSHLFLILFFNLVFIFSACNTDEPEKKNPDISDVKISDCKHFQKTVLDSLTSGDDCIEYTYDGANILSINHMNAGFNCCPEKVSADFVVAGDTIKITEKEKSAQCDCCCLFDLDYSISNISPGKYFIKVSEPYAGEGVKLEFEIDLRAQTSGCYCVQRDYYPWGM